MGNYKVKTQMHLGRRKDWEKIFAGNIFKGNLSCEVNERLTFARLEYTDCGSVICLLFVYTYIDVSPI